MPKTTHLQDLYSEHERFTQNQASPYYGMDPQQFAQKMQQMGVNRYDMLNEGKFMRGLQIVGDAGDRLGNAIGANDALGGLFASAAELFTDNPDAIEASRHAGEEAFSGLLSVAALAIPVAGVPLAVGSAGLDAYVDSREGGMSRETSTGIGAVSGAIMGLLPGVGKVSEGWLRGAVGGAMTHAVSEGAFASGVKFAAGRGLAKGGQSLMEKSLRASVPYVGREVAQFGVGSVGDVATTAINPELDLSDLLKEEMYIPILLGNTVFVAGDLVLIKPSQHLRGRMKAKSLGEAAADEATGRTFDQDFAADEAVKKALADYRDTLDQEQLAQWGSSTRQQLAARFAAYDMADAQARIVNSEDTGAAAFIDKFVEASHALDVPYGRLKTQALTIYNTFSGDPSKAHRALARAMKVVREDATRTYRQFPDTMEDTPSVRAIFKARGREFKSGEEHIVYRNTDEDVTVILKPSKTNEPDQLVAYKGTKLLLPDEMDAVLGKHRDGIAVGEAEFRADIEDIRMRAVENQGVAGTKSIPQNVVEGVREVMKGMGIDMPVLISTFDDVKTDTSFKGIKRFAAMSDDKGGTAMVDSSLGMAVVMVKGFGNDPLRSRVSSNDYMRLMHEVGHVVERNYVRLNPTAHEAIVKIHQEFGVEQSFRESGLPDTEVQSAAKRVGFEEKSFEEWFANQFARYMADPNAKVTSVTDSYFKGVVQQLRKLWEHIKAKFFLPEDHFKKWMDVQTRQFYSRIVGDNTPLLNRVRKTYLVNDYAADYLARQLYEHRDVSFHRLVEDRIADWHDRGRNVKFEDVVAKAVADYPTAPPQLRLEGSWQHGTTRQRLTPTYEASIVEQKLFLHDRTVPVEFLKRVTRLINYHVDQVDAMVIAQTLMLRHLHGEAPYATKKSKGSFAKYEKLLRDELHKHATAKNTKLLLQDDNTFKNNGKFRVFANELDARAEAGLINKHPALAGRYVEVLQNTDGTWRIETQFDEGLMRTGFDERYMNGEMDRLVLAEGERFVNQVVGGIATPREAAGGMTQFDVKLPKGFSEETYFHGTDVNFGKFDVNASRNTDAPDKAIYLTDSPQEARLAGSPDSSKSFVKAYHVKMKNPFYVDAMATEKQRSFGAAGYSKLIAMAKAKGHDSVIVDNVRDFGDTPQKTIILFKPEQLFERKTFEPNQAIDVSQFDLTIPREAASRTATRAASETPEAVAGATLNEFRNMLETQQLPDHMKANLKALADNMSDPAQLTEIKAIGKDFGWKGDNMNEFLTEYAKQISNGHADKTLSLLAGEKLKPVMQDVATLMGDFTRMEEFGARVGALTDTEKAVLSHISRRFSVDEHVDVDTAIEAAASLIQSMEPGGMADKLAALSRNKGLLGKAADAVAGNIIHLARRHPELAPFAEALLMEGAEQNAQFNKLMVQYHTDDPQTVFRDAKGDDLSQRVLDNGPLRAFMSRISRFVNIHDIQIKELRDKHIHNNSEFRNKLIKEGSEASLATLAELDAIQAGLRKLDPKTDGDMMVMFDRSSKVQMARAELTQIYLRDIDNLQLATFITKKTGTKNPQAALDLVNLMDKTDPNAWMGMLVKNGWDEALAMDVVRKKVQAMQMTDSIVKKMKQNLHFISEQRYGRFIVRYGKGKESGANSFDTYKEAQEFMAKHKELTFSSNAIEDTHARGRSGMARDTRDLLDSEIEAKKTVLEEMFGDDEQALKDVTGLFDQIFSSVDDDIANKAKRFLGKSRHFKPGREDLDMFTQQTISMRKAVLGLTRSKTDAIYNLFNQDERFSVEGGDRIRRMAAKARSNLRTPDTKEGRAITKLGFGLHMGFNASSMVQELVGIPWIVSPMARESGLGFLDSFRIPQKAIKELLASAVNKNYKWKDADHQQLLLRAAEDGKLSMRTILELNESVVAQDFKLSDLAAGNDSKRINPLNIWFNVAAKIYSQANKVSATATLITGWEAAKRANPKGSKESWYRSALDFHARTNGAGGRAQRLTYMPTGTLGQAAWSLQSFSHTTIANWVRWIDDGYLQGLKKNSQVSPEQRRNARKAANQAIAMTSLGMGVMGFPMMGALNAIIEKMTGMDVEKEIDAYLAGEDGENAYMTNFAMRGVAYASGLPIDLQSRMAVGGVFMANAYDGWNSGQIFGSVGSLVDNVRQALGHAQRGEFGESVASLLPTGLKRAGKLWAGGGSFKRNGEVLLDPTMTEAIGAVLGFTPQRLRKNYEMISANEYFQTSEQKERAQISKKALEIMTTGDVQRAQNYLKEQAKQLGSLRPLGDVYKSLANTTATMYANQGSHRQATLSPTRQAPAIQALYGTPQQGNAAEKYIKLQQAKTALGINTTSDRQRQKTYQRKYLADRMVEADPGLNLGLAEGLIGAYGELPDMFQNQQLFSGSNGLSLQP